MEGIWASLENTSEMVWSSIEAVWDKDVTWWGSDGYSQWDQFIYFINGVSYAVSLVHTMILTALCLVRWTGRSHGL